ncbi:hypothetical protein Gasu2_60410 [Galdieria sulphuraria]|nr:hypothetical protein Gasu2_60410 [Galdieria sulphuraria]
MFVPIDKLFFSLQTGSLKIDKKCDLKTVGSVAVEKLEEVYKVEKCKKSLEHKSVPSALFSRIFDDLSSIASLYLKTLLFCLNAVLYICYEGKEYLLAKYATSLISNIFLNWNLFQQELKIVLFCQMTFVENSA